jgi:hypothetical protein
MIQFPICEKLYEIFIEMEFQHKNEFNSITMIYKKKKKSIHHLIYDLKNLLIKNGINNIKTNDINPINIYTFLLRKLHYELNILNTNGQKGNFKANFTKVIYADKPKFEAYESYKKNYTSSLESIISQEFYGLIKIKHICKNCQKYKLENNYSFIALPYIPFDVKILSKMTHDKKDLNLYDAFNCLNFNIMEVKENKYIQCKKCKELSDYNELKQFYNLSKNLVIIIDRGETNIHKTFVDFPEDLYLDGYFVEAFKNKTVKYNLISIICMIEEEENQTKRSKKNLYYLKKWKIIIIIIIFRL